MQEQYDHTWKYMKVHPNGQELCFSVGVPCDICDFEDPYGTIMCVEIDNTSNTRYLAKGIRNSGGFDWHPTTEELWFISIVKEK